METMNVEKVKSETVKFDLPDHTKREKERKKV